MPRRQKGKHLKRRRSWHRGRGEARRWRQVANLREEEPCYGVYKPGVHVVGETESTPTLVKGFNTEKEALRFADDYASGRLDGHGKTGIVVKTFLRPSGRKKKS